MIDLEKKVYQMFILGLEETCLKPASNLHIALAKGLCGTILFTKNIQTIEQTKKLNEEIKNAAIIPPFLSIDEEGGRVERTENIFNGKKFLSAKFAAENGETFLVNQTIEISELLKTMGFNLNYAPCLDVNSNPNNPIIGERAFSERTEDVIRCGKIVNETYLENGIITCGKHYPGHGDASVDSHKALPVIDLPIDEMKEIHIRPFLEVNPPMIMVAHLHCKAFDEEKIPSSLSKNVIGNLRNNGYEGLLISDDMVMGGVKGNSPVEAAISAIKAGINILLYRDSYDETISIIEAVINEAKRDEALLKSIEESYEKILNLKKSLILM